MGRRVPHRPDTLNRLLEASFPMALLVAEHPGRESLHAFGLGRLTGAEAQHIEQHVEQCQHCCEQLRDVADDSLVSTLRRLEHSAAAETLGSAGSSLTGVESTVPTALHDHPRYRIEECLGKGGMGVVYRAEHRLMHRQVALKVIHPRLVDRPQAVARFRQEVQAAARLNDEHVVHAYDAEHVDDTHFLVMEFVDGESVDRLIAEQGQLAIAPACDYARQAAMGLQAAHRQGMAHRDIKPQNLMLVRKGCVKVLDFGLARFVLEQHQEQTTALTTGHLVLGTPDYMAPEQARESRAADIRSDIYSLGCTLYHMLTGQPPFPEGSVIEKLALHMNSRPKPLHTLRPDMPAGLADVIDRMTARKPEDRYPLPADVAEALAPYTKPLPPEVARPRRWLSRRSMIAAAGGALLVAIGVAALTLMDSPVDAPGAATGFGDDFAGDRLSSKWSVLQPQSGQVSVENGALVLVPDDNTGWYNGGHGMLVYQDVKGDFVATTRVSVAGTRDPSGPPTQQFNSAGLVARDPNSQATTENWIMVSLGQQQSFLGTKTEPTALSKSQPQFQPARSSTGELRIARIGDTFFLLKKLTDESEWKLLQTHTFPRFPESLQVGLAVNAYRTADICAEFDDVRTYVPTSASDLYRD